MVLENKISFEFTDIHCNNESYCNEVLLKCKMLCDIFEFEIESQKISDIMGLPYLTFSIVFASTIINFEHKMNVIKAFAQEYQLTITFGTQEQITFDL